MSFDPALSPVSPPTGTLSLSDLSIDPEALYVFDFDGVVCDPLEEASYRIESWPEELEILARVAAHFNIRCQEMEPRYQRHLLYEACAYEQNIPTEPGPAFPLLKEACEKARAFILTARSGWHAVERMRLFLKENDLCPLELFNVGRTGKALQIDLLCREFPARAVYYIEDSPAHLAQAAALDHKNFHPVLTPKHVKESIQELRDMEMRVFSAVLAQKRIKTVSR